MTESSAILSKDGKYRYYLQRSWGIGPTMTFVMLNPSTADATADDPTIRRCIQFADDSECKSLAVVNLYALRSTNPKRLWDDDDPVGPDNDHHLRAVLRQSPLSGVIVCAWGANARQDRVKAFLDIAQPYGRQLLCLGKTKQRRKSDIAMPRHPLYLRRDTPFEEYP